MDNNKIKPPSFALWILNRVSLPEDLSALKGDLVEDYLCNVQKAGKISAALSCWIEVLCSFTTFLTYNFKWSIIMFTNYFKVAFRNFKRKKGYTFINIFSLIVGITCFMLLMVYVKYELSYDSFHKKSDRIYMLGQYVPSWNFGGSHFYAMTNGAVAPVLKHEFPEVENSVRIADTNTPITYEQRSFPGNGLFVDNDFLNIFTFPLIKGDKNSALKEPFSIILSESLSDKLFGKEESIGKLITHEDGDKYTVKGIFKDVPGNSHLKFDYLLSFTTYSSFRNDVNTKWSILNYWTYIQLKKGSSYKEFEKKLPYIVNRYHEEDDKDRYYFLVPLKNVHFDTTTNFLLSPPIDKKYIYLFISIAFVILIIACVNYMNLATARASVRSREVGIRKAVGAERSQLIKQFLGDSFIQTFLSILISLFIVYLIFPYFAKIAQNDIKLNVLRDWTTVLYLFGLLIVVGFLSGSYPALLLSSLRPVQVLKTSFKSGLSCSQLKFRNILVVFQFCVSIILIAAAIVIQKQLFYIKYKDIGYNRENIVCMRLWDDESRQNYQLIKNELLKNPNISSTTVSNVAPVKVTEVTRITIESESGEMVKIPQVTCYFTDYDYFDVFNMKVAAGRKFSSEFAGNIENSVIINETAAKIAGLENPIGKKLVRWEQEYHIVGVVKDFHFESLRTKIEPIMFLYGPQRGRMFFTKISNKDINRTLGYIQTSFQKFNRNFVFDYAFMDDMFNNLYGTEQKLSGILISFSILTIIIASLGLFGLISFIVERKTKEVGIRKVLGASTFTIIRLITKEFLSLIVAALIIALPAAYYFTNKWLQSFTYRTGLSIWLFVLSASIVILIALLSMSSQTIKSARANPVESLKVE
ncbi:ABC transporter permease [candidate division KSB1 bacterium]